MNGFGLAAVLLVVPGWCRGDPLDKTGTTGWQNGAGGVKTLENKEPAGAGSFGAERAGFDPDTGPGAPIGFTSRFRSWGSSSPVRQSN